MTLAERLAARKAAFKERLKSRKERLAARIAEAKAQQLQRIYLPGRERLIAKTKQEKPNEETNA